MRNFLITLIILMISITSCDPESTTTYQINNSTKSHLKMIFSSSIYISDTIEISSQEVGIWKVDTHYGSPSTKIDLTFLYDSVMIKDDMEILKVFKPETLGKNIYNFDYWDKNKKKKRDYEYTFVITEEDIIQ